MKSRNGPISLKYFPIDSINFKLDFRIFTDELLRLSSNMSFVKNEFIFLICSMNDKQANINDSTDTIYIFTIIKQTKVTHVNFINLL